MARVVGVGASISVQFGVLVSFGALAGRYLDSRLGGDWRAAAGILLGSLAAFINMLLLLKYLERMNARDEKRD